MRFIEKKPSIQPTKNGPYLVKDLIDFKNSKNEDIPIRPTMTLCRCGGSHTKPFCDGTHLTNGFNDNKEPDRQPDKLDTYEGKDVTIHDNRGVCSHRGHCTDNLPKVFRMKQEPWIDPNEEPTEEVARVIHMCPSGALSYTKDGILYKNIDRESKIIISKNGPYDIQGFIVLDDPDNNQPESKEHYTLCRCGHSKNIPFCSGQHWYVKFNDPKN